MFSARNILKIKEAANKMPLSTRKAIFAEAGMPDINRQSCCNLLRKIAKIQKPVKMPWFVKSEC